MITILTLFIILWFMIFTASRFLQYYRIVTEYKERTIATVEEITDHPKARKKDKPAKDVLMSYELNGERMKSEITVPADTIDRYTIGKEFEICCKVDPNGTVHIASWSSANKKIMFSHLGALAVEMAAFVIVALYA
ncbi:MAG: hypothetical protein Q4B03_09800 [Lachnospiraceae bacterium]|nr:hypothetical protein [Lachnospiraceae bacterium]